MAGGHAASAGNLPAVTQELTGITLARGAEVLGPVATLPPDRQAQLVYLASLSTAKGRRAQRCALDTIARELGALDADHVPWHLLRYQHTNAIRAKLIARYAHTTANRHLAALRGVLREASRLGLMSAEDCTRACDLKPARGERPPAGRALAEDERAAMLAACDRSTVAGVRDAAIVSVLYGAGLRREELVRLDLEDLGTTEDFELRVRGKGAKVRMVPAPSAREAVEEWKALRRGGACPALFLPIDRWGRQAARRMTDQAVYVIHGRLAARAGVEASSPHNWRHTAITELLDRTPDVASVQKFAGHALLSTTLGYDRRGQRAVRTAAAQLPPIPTKKPATSAGGGRSC